MYLFGRVSFWLSTFGLIKKNFNQLLILYQGLQFWYFTNFYNLFATQTTDFSQIVSDTIDLSHL